MIIIRIYGGLGNQMFQYAMGRAVAFRNNLQLMLDISYFENHTLRFYRLSSFNIKADIATKEEISHFRLRRRQVIAYAVNKTRKMFLPWYKQRIIRQRGFSYDPEILEVKGSAYLDGYWQSEKYFIDITRIIQNEFTIKNQPDDINTIMLELIDSKNAVSLHIRRGEYVSNPETRQIHGVINLDYYMSAIDFIYQNNKDAHIFVFSDDIPWARENLKTSLPVDFMDHNAADKDCEDLRLMSHCKHHIIANSSFSWWGAWLAKNPNKIVIAPKRWFSEIEMVKRQKIDVILERWIKL